jgi:ADP-ribose pyrophosphatase YjhB (NUDIX family)
VTDNMVWFEKGDMRFLLCTRGIAFKQERVLLFNVVGWDWWTLPGGRVEMLEHSDNALKREMREEIATDIVVGELVWVIENFFKPNNTAYHEIGMYYLMYLPDDSVVFKSTEYTCQDGPVTLRFRWFFLSDIEQVEIRPAFLKKGLLHIPQHTEHITWDDK